jgi:Skp family chaperone for outer membrane proteins
VRTFRLLAASGFAGVALFANPLPAGAQQSQDWFVPGQAQRPAAAPRAPAHPPAPGAAAAPAAAPVTPQESAVPNLASPPPPDQDQQVQVQLPPPPEIPPLPKGPTPPAAIVGVLSVPDVMRASTAFLEADKVVGGRRQKLNADAQKEQVTLRDLGQALANERSKLTPDQIRGREKELQDRITESRRVFGERNRIIQEASQYVVAQIDRAVELVTQQVASSRGINLVLNRAQILGTTNEFDLTPQVVESLNKVLPTVLIPPDGVSPMAMKPPAGGATATPASAPVAGAPAAPPTAAAKPAAKPPAARRSIAERA